MGVVTIYGDESSQNAFTYMVLGTIWDACGVCDGLEEDIVKLKEETNFVGKEFHWCELKGHHLRAYKGLVDIFANCLEQGNVKFRALVVDQSDIKHKSYSEDDELHFYKMFFWLIFKNLRRPHQYDILLDRKTNSVSGRLSDLKSALNNKWFNDFALGVNLADLDKSDFTKVRRVEPRDGSQIALQLADIFAGAIAYKRNGHYESSKNNPKNPKVQLLHYMEEKLGVDFLTNHLPGQSPEFNIWRFKR